MLRSKALGIIFLGGLVFLIGFVTLNEMRPKPHHERRLDRVLTLGAKEPESPKKATQIRNDGKKVFYTQDRTKTELSYDTSTLVLETLGIHETIDRALLLNDGSEVVLQNSKVTFETGEILAEKIFLKNEKFSGTAEAMTGNLNIKGAIVQNVVVTFEPSGKLTCDRGELIGKELKGSGNCLLTTPGGLKIASPMMTIVEKTVRFENPQGDYTHEGKTMNFTANSLTWVLDKKEMVLDGNVKIALHPFVWQVPQVLFVFNDAEMPEMIKGTGDMLFENQKRKMTLKTRGTAVFSSNTLTVEKGEEQIHINDPFGQIFADRALFTLNNNESESIDIEGNVSMINKMFSPKEALQYIIADKVHMAMDTQTASFQALPGKRVLIMDKINKMHVSAPSITATRGKGLLPLSIKGGGDVRFSFKDEELAEIKKRFKQGTR